MQIKWPWFEREFNFDFPPEKMPDIVERLRGTPQRAVALVSDLSEEQLTWLESDGTWSIQENIAHLADIEPLWTGRIDDICSGMATMRAADLTNAATNQARHNNKTIGEILRAVESARATLVELIDALSPEQYALSSMHPRLEKPMRIVDLCLFVADHDDYHLARARYLKRTLPL